MDAPKRTFDQMKRIRDQLIRHEGLRLRAYKCPAGKTSIGVGRNLDDVGITQTEAMILLNNDLDRVVQEATLNFPWFNSISVVRQDVVLNMIFNMGLGTFKQFKNFIEYLKNGNFEKASEEMKASKWAIQVADRANELSQMMILDRYI